MESRIRDLQRQIAALEHELSAAIAERESQVRFTIRLKRSVYHWLVTDRRQNLLTGPIICALAIPLLLMDLVVTIYQATCFPVYRIAKVRRRDYITFDRHQLGYLNAFERFHCEYCGYANRR